MFHIYDIIQSVYKKYVSIYCGTAHELKRHGNEN
jgi:hypothetical protein